MIDATILDVEEGLWPPSRIAHRDCPSCGCERNGAFDPVDAEPVMLAQDPGGHVWLTNRFILLRDDVVKLPGGRRTKALDATTVRAVAALAAASPDLTAPPTSALFQAHALDLLDAVGARVLPHQVGVRDDKPLAQRPHAIVLDGHKVGAIMPGWVIDDELSSTLRTVTA